MAILISVTIPIITLLLAILIRIANTPPAIFESNPLQYFGVEFELLLISFSVLVGSYFTQKKSDIGTGKLFIPMLVIFIFTIFCFALEVISKTNLRIIGQFSPWFQIWIPNFLGITSVSWSVYTVQNN